VLSISGLLEGSQEVGDHHSIESDWEHCFWNAFKSLTGYEHTIVAEHHITELLTILVLILILLHVLLLLLLLLLLHASEQWSLVELGISNAIQLQQAIVRQGSWLLDHHITHSGPFRYAFLTQTADVHRFTHPLALVKLSLFLLEVLRSRSVKPIVLCALNAASNTYLIAGTCKANKYVFSLLLQLVVRCAPAMRLTV
jgi:hypothetical protein